MSTVEVIAIAGVLSALAYWLGHAAGHAKAIRSAVLWLRHYGVRNADFATRTITFSDGTTHTEQQP